MSLYNAIQWHVLENQGGLPYKHNWGAPCLTFFFSILFILPQNTKDKNTRLSLTGENECGEETRKETLSHKHWTPSEYKSISYNKGCRNCKFGLLKVRVSKVESQLLF